MVGALLTYKRVPVTDPDTHTPVRIPHECRNSFQKQKMDQENHKNRKNAWIQIQAVSHRWMEMTIWCSNVVTSHVAE